MEYYSLIRNSNFNLPNFHKIILLFLIIIFSLNSYGASKIPIFLKNPTEIKICDYPVTIGVPFPKKKLWNIKNIELKDAYGKQIPVQVITTSKWPDKSIRWILVDFQIDLDGTKEQKLNLKYNETKKNKKVQGITILTDPKGWNINTGSALFKISSQRYNFIDQVSIAGNTVIQSCEQTGPFLQDASGKEFRASWGKPDDIEIELQGPIRSVIKAEGWFYSKSGEKLCRYIVRTNFFKNKKYVKSFFTFIITVPTKYAKFSDIGFRIPFNLNTVKFTGKEQVSRLLPGQIRYILQYDSNKYFIGEGSKSRKWKNKGDGKHAPGWAVVSNDVDSMLIKVNHFWQNFPNELEAVGKQALTYHFWPRHGISMPEREIGDKELQYLWFCHEGKILNMGINKSYKTALEKRKNNSRFRYFKRASEENCMGVAKTAEIYLGFNNDPAEQQNLLKFWRVTPSAVVSPEWMCSSGVFGVLHPFDEKSFSKAERVLSKAFDCERRLQDFTGDYGKFNFGDMHTKWDYQRNRWDDGYRCWRGYHHGSARTPWLLYVRSGDLKYLRWAVCNTRHIMDVDTCNYATPEYERKPYPYGKIPGALNDYKGLTHWHSGSRLYDYNCMTDFMLYYYFMTGDKRGLDIAEMWGESILKADKKALTGRNGAGVCSALLELYTGTGKDAYFSLAESIIKNMFKYQNLKGDKTYSRHTGLYIPSRGFPLPIGAFSGGWENYAPFLERYYNVTGNKEAAQRLVKWADAFCDGYGGTSSIWGTGDCLNILAYAWFITKKTKYLEYGKWEMRRFLNSTINKPGELLDGFIDIGQTSLSSFMIQRIPVFLAALAEADKAVESRAPTESISKYPFIWQNDIGRIYEFLLLNNKLQDINISGRIISRDQRSKPRIQLFDQEGKLVIDKTVTNTGCNNFDFKLGACPKGVYRLMCKGAYHILLEVKPRLRQLVKAKRLRQRTGGTQLYFRIPENCVNLNMKLFTARNIPTNIQLINNEGKIVKTIDYYPFKFKNQIKTTIQIPENQRNTLWCIKGRFGKGCHLELKSNTTHPIECFAVKPDFYFDINKHKVSPSITAKSEIKVLKESVIATPVSGNKSRSVAAYKPEPPGIHIIRDNGKLSNICIFTGAGKLTMRNAKWNNVSVFTAKGKKIALVDPFLYNMRDADCNIYLTDKAIWPSMKVEKPNDRNLILQLKPPNSVMTKTVSISMEKGKNVLYVINSNKARKYNKLSSDNQCIYIMNLSDYKITVDGKDFDFNKRKRADKFEWIGLYNKKINITVGLIFMPNEKNWNSLSVVKNNMDLQWGRNVRTYKAGEQREQKYILIWGDGNLLQETEKFANQSETGQLDNRFYFGNKYFQ